MIRSLRCIDVPNRRKRKRGHWVWNLTEGQIIKVNMNDSFLDDVGRWDIFKNSDGKVGRGDIFKNSDGKVLLQFCK